MHAPQYVGHCPAATGYVAAAPWYGPPCLVLYLTHITHGLLLGQCLWPAQPQLSKLIHSGPPGVREYCQVLFLPHYSTFEECLGREGFTFVTSTAVVAVTGTYRPLVPRLERVCMKVWTGFQQTSPASSKCHNFTSNLFCPVDLCITRSGTSRCKLWSSCHPLTCVW